MLVEKAQEVDLDPGLTSDTAVLHERSMYFESEVFVYTTWLLFKFCFYN